MTKQLSRQRWQVIDFMSSLRTVFVLQFTPLFAMMLIVALAACAGPVMEQTVEPAGSPTADGALLEVTSTPSTEPAPTTPAVATTTTVVTATLVTTKPADEADLPTPDEKNGEPGEQPDESLEPAIVFSREGGLAGIMQTWEIYADGRTVRDDSAEWQVAPDMVSELLDTIEQAGFFELEPPKTTDICCDFFTYTITVLDGVREKTVIFSEGDPDLAPGLQSVVAAILEFITAKPA
jgi:hypothetical protein